MSRPTCVTHASQSDRAQTPATEISGDAIPLRYRCTTPYYDLVVLTSPARIEQLAIDPAGRGEHRGVVNNFGPRGSSIVAAYGASMILKEDHASDAGRPQRVRSGPGRLVLEGIPVGSRGLFADWTFLFDERTFDMVIDWQALAPQSDLWEAGWKLDGIARHIGDADAGDLPLSDRGPFAARGDARLLWWEDDPRYAHTLVTAFAPGSADRGDGITVAPNIRRPVTWGGWYTIKTPGGSSLPAGTLRGGRWRVGASAKALDLAYGAALSREVAGGPPAIPAAASAPLPSDSRAAIAWAQKNLPSRGDAKAGGPVLQAADRSWLLTDGERLAAFVPVGGRELRLRIFVGVEEGWQLSLTNGPTWRAVSVEPDGAATALRVCAEGLGQDGMVKTTTDEIWSMPSRPGRIHVESTDTPVAGSRAHPLHTFLVYAEGRNKHEIGGYDVLASPHLRPQADLVIGQHAMRSPVLAVQKGRAAVALVPDLLFHRQHGCYGPEHAPTHFGLCMDFDVANRLIDAPLLGFGWRQMAWVYLDVGVEQGGYYCRDLGETAPAQPVRVAFDLILRADAPERSIVGETQRFLWEQIGHRYFAQSALPQTQPADQAFDEAWTYWEAMYQSATVGAKEVGGVRSDADAPPNLTFSAWFNALRSSYAIYARGRGRIDGRLMQQGRATLDLLLSAPRKDGAFPTIARFTPRGVDWSGSHANFANQMPWGPTTYHTMDMSWVAYTMLRWLQDLDADAEALAFARDYGDFLLNHQLPTGAIPSWLRMADLAVDPHLRESAQTSASALFLAELAWVTRDPRYRRAAIAAGRFLVEECVLAQRWDDFEVYFSNSPKSEGASDPISGQSAQDTLSMHFAAAALLRLFQLSGERIWLEAGEQTLATMLQYQAVWPPSFLSVYAYGGFSVQNTDQEWLDARQSQLATTLLDYARETGRADYAERGIAALRSGYATMMSPSAEVINPRFFASLPRGWGNENYAHSAYDTVTRSVPSPAYDWGVGSAAAGYAEARIRFGDVWVDARHGRAFGIDDTSVRSFAFGSDWLSLEITSPGAGRAVTLKANGFRPGPVRLRVNGGSDQIHSAENLEAGVTVSTCAALRLVHNPARSGPALAGEPFHVELRVLFDRPAEGAKVRYRRSCGEWAASALHSGDGRTWRGTLPAAEMIKGQPLNYTFEAHAAGQIGTAPEVDPEAVPFVQMPT